MNELDKTISEKEIVTPSAAESPEVNLEKTVEETTECKIESNGCAETESPAEAISEATDAIEGEAAAEGKCAEDGVCVETESPAESISEATDAIEGEAVAEGAKNDTRSFHSMSKEELVQSLQEIVSEKNVKAYKEVALIKQSFYILHNKEIEEKLMAFIDEGNSPENFVSPSDVSEVKLKELLAEFKDMRAAYIENEQTRLAANQDKANHILEEMHKLIEDIDNINLNFNNFRELQQQFREIKDVPPTVETELWKKFQQAGEEFYDRLKVNRELRDLDFKKNLEAKELLISEAQKLLDAPDPLAAFRRQQELQAMWREIGPVAKDIRDEVWNRFREASTIIFKRHQDYFTARKAEEMAAQSRKGDLCEKVESINLEELTTAAKWEEATKQIIDYQAQWKEAGFASRKVNNQLFQRFREACDKFFNAKTEYFKATKAALQSNLEKKIALCEKVEAMKESLDVTNLQEVRSACDKVAEIQKDWRTVGTAPRKQSDAVWKRFCDACNFFYETRNKLNSTQRKEESENLTKKRDIIARLKEIDTKGDRQDGIAKLRELQSEWQATGYVPRKYMNEVMDGYRAVVKTLSEELDVRGRREHLTNFGARVDKLTGNDNQIQREREKLYRALDAKRSELKTAENNLGFFNVKSSSGNVLLQEAQRRIERIKEDISMIQQKIDLLKSKIDQES